MTFCQLVKNIKPSNKSFKDFLPISTSNSIVMLPTTKSEVFKVIKELKNNSSPGLDNVPTNIIKFASEFISEPLAELINCSMKSGIFPDKLKVAKVIPIFKTGDRSLINNYRPISILNAFSKIFEKVILSRLLGFLNKQNFFYSQQFGFRQNHSTSAALISFTEYISNAIDKNEIPISIFIDFSKAFDTLDHKILLEKLLHYGIQGVSYELFKNYLANRAQCVYYKNTYSDFLPITCRVSQGSVLGPILFLIYMNDINRSSSILTFILFADDTTILFSSNSLDNLNLIINKELISVNEWIKANKLSLNISKTNFIIFKKKLQSPQNFVIVTMENTIIKQVTSTKFLGVNINTENGWKDHINEVTKKISRALGIIRRIRYKLTTKTAMLLYDALILSHITYCNIVWAATYKTRLKWLYVMQKELSEYA